MQIGFVGLGKMGGNMVHRIERDSDHEVVAFDPNADAVAAAEGHGAIGASSLEELVSKLEHAADGLADGAVGQHHRVHDHQARRPARRGRHDRRRRQLQLARRPAARGGARAARASTTPTSAPRGGVWGLDIGYCMMAGGPDESIAAARADPRRARAAGRLAPLRPRGRRALREDGPQRRGVRDDAGLRRGLRSHAQVGVPDRAQGGRGALEPRLGRALLAVRAGRAARSSRRATTSAACRATSTTPARAAG